MITDPTEADSTWPALAYADWKPTIDTLHMWLQIVGTVRLELTPLLNDRWNVTFAVTARGLSTLTIPFGPRVVQVDFDFIDHHLTLHASDGRSVSMPLAARSVADFFGEFMTHVESVGIQVKINTHPVEVDNGIPFEDDYIHAAYDPTFVNRWWHVLLGVTGVLEDVNSLRSTTAGTF